MSHVTEITLEISDIPALEAAAQVMGGSLVRQSTYNWYGFHVGDYPMPAGMTKDQLGKCEYAIKLPGVHYEVGVVRKANGKFGLVYDFFGSDCNGKHDGHKLRETFGDDLKKLQQRYAVEAAKIAAKKKGWMVREQNLANGSIKLQFVGGGM